MTSWFTLDSKLIYCLYFYFIFLYFSKFVVPGSKRIHIIQKGENKNLHSVAFLLPDNSVVLSVLNK